MLRFMRPAPWQGPRPPFWKFILVSFVCVTFSPIIVIILWAAEHKIRRAEDQMQEYLDQNKDELATAMAAEFVDETERKAQQEIYREALRTMPEDEVAFLEGSRLHDLWVEECMRRDDVEDIGD